MPIFKLDQFKQRLAETRAYCEPRFSSDDLVGCLRTGDDPQKEFGGTFRKITCYAQQTFKKRQVALKGVDLSLYSGLGLGRLFVSYLSSQTCTGTSWGYTNGFIDRCDVPPWDTWVWYGLQRYPEGTKSKYYGNEYLIAWIPPEMMDKISGCIM